MAEDDTREDKIRFLAEIKTKDKQDNEINLKNYLESKIHQREIVTRKSTKKKSIKTTNHDSSSSFKKIDSLSFLRPNTGSLHAISKEGSKTKFPSLNIINTRLQSSKCKSNMNKHALSGFSDYRYKILQELLKEAKKETNILKNDNLKSNHSYHRFESEESLILNKDDALTSRQEYIANSYQKKKVDIQANLDPHRRLKKMKLVYDSISDCDLMELESLKKSSWALSSRARMTEIYNIFKILTLILMIMTFPYNMTAYLIDSEIKINFMICIELFGEFLMTLDIIMTLMLGKYIDDEFVINPRLIIINHFQSGKGFFELVVFFPYTFLMFMLSKQLGSRKGINNIRLIKFLGVFKLWHILDEFARYKLKIGYNKRMLYKIVLITVIFINFFSCLWIYIGLSEQQSQGKSWITAANLESSGQFYIYITAVYFQLVTLFTVGYGDICPITINEKVYTICFLIISNFYYSFLVGLISKIIYKMSQKEEFFAQKKGILQSILKENKVAIPLKSKLKKSLKMMQKNYLGDKHYMLNSLPDQLRTTVYKHLYGEKIGNLRFFKGVTEDFELNCLTKMQLINLTYGETLISIGDIYTEMYMINTGSLRFYMGHQFMNYGLLSIKRGYHLGDISMFLNERSDFNVVCKSKEAAEIFTMNKQVFLDLRKSHPFIMESIISQSIEYYESIEQLKKKAYEYFDTYDSFEGFRLAVSLTKITEINRQIDLEILSDRIKTTTSNTKIIGLSSKEDTTNEVSINAINKEIIDKQDRSNQCKDKDRITKVIHIKQNLPTFKLRQKKEFTEDYRSPISRANNIENTINAGIFEQNANGDSISKVKMIITDKLFAEDYCKLYHLIDHLGHIDYVTDNSAVKKNPISQSQSIELSEKVEKHRRVTILGLINLNISKKGKGITPHSLKPYSDGQSKFESSNTDMIEISPHSVDLNEKTLKLPRKKLKFTVIPQPSRIMGNLRCDSIVKEHLQRASILNTRSSSSTLVKGNFKSVITKGHSTEQRVRLEKSINMEMNRNAFFNNNINFFEEHLKSYLLNSKEAKKEKYNSMVLPSKKS